jgi:hypothetical protein
VSCSLPRRSAPSCATLDGRASAVDQEQRACALDQRRCRTLDDAIGFLSHFAHLQQLTQLGEPLDLVGAPLCASRRVGELLVHERELVGDATPVTRVQIREAPGNRHEAHGREAAPRQAAGDDDRRNGHQ